MAKRWTIKELLTVATDYLYKKNIDSPRLAAEVLLAHVLGVKRIDLYLDFERPLTSAEVSQYRELVRRRVAREPLQYITGRQEFWSLEFIVNNHVLIPRPETELLVEQAVEHCKERIKSGEQRVAVLDLCTGCGAVAISIAKEMPQATLWASDISSEAISIAKANAQRHGVSGKIEFLEGDLFGPARDKGLHFHIIVANPPYVAEEEYEKLPPEVRDYEPRVSLDGGPGGMVIIERILREAPDFLKPKGVVIIEMSPAQVAEAKDLISSLPRYRICRVLKDYSGLDRVVVAQR